MKLDIRQLYDTQLATKVDRGYSLKLPIKPRYRKMMIDLEPSHNGDGFLGRIPANRLYFASDHHFGHNNIIKYVNRPFNSVEEMNETLIERHNMVVGVDDYCVFGGDIAFCPASEANQHLSRMNGHKIFVVGNHDFERDGSWKAYDVRSRHLFWEVMQGHAGGPIEEFAMVFTHYPLNGLPNDVINFHGHIHDKLSPNSQHINLCVEHWDYAPVSMQQLLPIARSRFEEMRG